MTNLVLREWLNGGLIPLNICIMLVIGHTLWCARVDYGRDWNKQPGVASACALWWVFAADLIRSVLAWDILHAQNNGAPLTYVNSLPTTFYILAAVIASIATLRLIFISWGHKGWMAAALLVAAMLLLVERIPMSAITGVENGVVNYSSIFFGLF